MSFNYPSRIGPFIHKNDKVATLMYVVGRMPWVERSYVKVGDASVCGVFLTGGEMLVNDWNSHGSHDRFMKDLVNAKNNNAIREMELYPDLRILCIQFRAPLALGVQTDVQTIWFWY